MLLKDTGDLPDYCPDKLPGTERLMAKMEILQSYQLTNKQARRFLLRKQGLLGGYRFTGKEGICDFVRQAGCVQFDPIDICGKNAELVLQSRVKGFTKQMLYELLYRDRRLLDYFDKNLSVIDINDWKYFERMREENRTSGLGREEVDSVIGRVKEIIREKGSVCSKDFDLGKRINWYWGNNTSLSRVALETLYFRGDLIIHRKKGAVKYYALAEDYIPADILTARDPFTDETEHMKWRVLRRISAVGLLWNKPSDAWLNIRNMKAAERERVFSELLEEKKIIGISVENMKDTLYCLASDGRLAEEVLNNAAFKGRTELLAPLDSLLWDRKLVKALFDFDYKWEIYTPVKDRKYGYYVLPILSGDRFAGRAEIINNRREKTLEVKNIWWEDGIRKTGKLSDDLKCCMLRFAGFNDCLDVRYHCNIYN